MLSHIGELFKKNFIETQGGDGFRDMILYGLGKPTEEILKAFPAFPVAGLLDGYREDGEFCGKQIIALTSLAGRNVQIVILARKASEKVIYRRIKDFCREQAIPVYGADGGLLGQVLYGEDPGDGAIRQEKEEYFLRSLDELRQMANHYDTISFDIFDTLLIRRAQPEKIFRLVGKAEGMTPDFAQLRMGAELELSRSGSPTIYDIYRWVGERMGISPDRYTELLEREIAVEVSILEPRDSMVRFLGEMVSQGKNVYLVSDMYLPGKVLEGILQRKGIGGYKGLFVSCDYNVSKARGLYDCYCRHSQGERRMHIGDSEELDGRAAKAHGIEPYVIKSPQDMAELTAVGRLLLQVEETADMQGMISARIYRDPFALHGCGGRLQTASARDLGYGILGPLAVGYVHWLWGRLMEEPVDVMLFVARDGYLVKKVFDLWKSAKGCGKLPESVYLLTSRTFSVLASLRNEADILYAAELPFNGSPEEMLEKRFGLQGEEILPRKGDEEDFRYIMRHEEAILSKAAHARQGYQEYLAGLGLKDKRLGIYDFISTGTCQLCLEKIMGTSMKGYYFQRLEDSLEEKRRLTVEDFVGGHKPDYDCGNYFLLESWMKAPHPSIKYVTAQGQVRYCESHDASGQREHICLLQEGALEFGRDYLKEAGGPEAGAEIEKLAVSLLPYVDQEFLHIGMEELTYYDEFFARAVKIC